MTLTCQVTFGQRSRPGHTLVRLSFGGGSYRDPPVNPRPVADSTAVNRSRFITERRQRSQGLQPGLRMGYSDRVAVTSAHWRGPLADGAANFGRTVSRQPALVTGTRNPPPVVGSTARVEGDNSGDGARAVHTDVN